MFDRWYPSADEAPERSAPGPVPRPLEPPEAYKDVPRRAQPPPVDGYRASLRGVLPGPGR
jgi:hypothetical protein